MHEPSTGYDAIIVGAGRRGLAIAYHLAVRHGLTDVAVLDRGEILDQAAWAHAAAACGVDLIADCEVTGILTHRGRVAGVETTRGCIEAPRVALATGDHTSALADVVPLDGLFLSCDWGAGREYAETIATGALIEHAVAAVAR